MGIFGIRYDDLLRKTKITPGTTLRVLQRGDDGRKIGTVKAKVVEVYRHHVLLDFGKYRESRRKADIVLGLCDVVG